MRVARVSPRFAFQESFRFTSGVLGNFPFILYIHRVTNYELKESFREYT